MGDSHGVEYPLLSKGGVIVDVTDTVAELITESAGSLTAFTAVSGDATGDIAVNPNYILTVDSANSGTYSCFTLCDNVSPQARITVDTAYADMDAIIEVAAVVQPLIRFTRRFFRSLAPMLRLQRYYKTRLAGR